MYNAQTGHSPLGEGSYLVSNHIWYRIISWHSIFPLFEPELDQLSESTTWDVVLSYDMEKIKAAL